MFNIIHKLTKSGIGFYCFLLLISLQSTSAQENLAPDMQRIFKQKKIVVALHFKDLNPFYTVSNKQLDGFDIALVKDMAKNLGIDVEFNRNAKTFGDIIDMVASKEVDIALSCISRTQKRAIRVNFSTPYIKLYHAFILNRLRMASLKKVSSFEEQLNSPDVIIGTIKSSSYEEWAQRDYPKAKLVLYENWDEIANATVKGEISAGYFDDNQVLKWANENPENMLYVQAKVLKNKEDPISVVINWRDTHLLHWINLYLDINEKNGHLEKMKKRYFKNSYIKVSK